MGPPLHAVLDALFTARLQEIHNDHQNQNHCEHERKECIDLRLDRLFGVVVDLDGKGDEARARDEIRNDEVVEAHGKGHQGAGDNAGHDLVDDDLCERLKRRAAEIQRGLDQILVHLLELRHDVQDDVGEIERDVRDKQRPEAEDRVDAEHRARKGERLLSPSEQQHILNILRNCGVTTTQEFDAYVEDYDW